MLKNKKTTVVLLGVLLVAVIITVGITYALWQITLQQETTNVITTGCFKVTLEEGDAITLNNAFPITDEEGKELTPYTFTIKNSCNEKASYVINLETISTGDKILSDEYVKASLKNNEKELFLSTLNSTNENVEKVIESSLKAYKLTTGVLNANEEKTFELRLWMDENTPTVDDAMNANYMGKITISSSYVTPPNTKNMMVPYSAKQFCDSGGCEYINLTYTLNRTYEVNKVIYESSKYTHDNIEASVDFSVNQDGSVMGYYVKENGEYPTYTLYIQAEGKIKINPIASYFATYQEVYGLENVDTSEVVDMSSMFLNMKSITDLDVSNFDTSNVTDMSNMFSRLSNLTSLDISHFDTSNVINMYSMFSGLSSLTSLDISKFDTSNVYSMDYMFSNSDKLTTTINIKNPNLVNYIKMFSGAATKDGAQITVNYTTETSGLVDRMIATKSENSNVVKGSLIS